MVTTLTETLLIVMLVIFLFMGRIRTVLVPVLAIPISLIGAVFLMQIFGFTINLLTLLAIVLSVGLVVDDAIIVVENIERHLEEGMEPVKAAMLGVRELIGPVIATTLVLVAVYLPIAFQGGLTGSLFREFALTLSGAVIVSSIVALTLSPMLSSKVITSGEHRGLAKLINGGFARLRELYGRVLTVSLRSRGVIYFAWGVLTLACLPMFVISSKELAPKEDQGVVFGIVDAPAKPRPARERPLRPSAPTRSTSASRNPLHLPDQNPPGGRIQRRGPAPWGQRERTAFRDRAPRTSKASNEALAASTLIRDHAGPPSGRGGETSRSIS